MREKTPRIFVSHNHADTNWCQAFVNSLKQQGYDAWYYEGMLGPGDAFVPIIEKEIIDRQVFMMLLTPDARKSQWVDREFQLAMYYKRKIIPIVLKRVDTDGFVNTYQRVDVIGYDAASAALRVIAEALDPYYETPLKRSAEQTPEKARYNVQPPGDPFSKFRR